MLHYSFNQIEFWTAHENIKEYDFACEIHNFYHN